MAFVDARTLPEGFEIDADLVIVGGGMAGIALARQFAGTSTKVAVIESGGRDMDMTVQDLYRGSAAMRAPGNPDRPMNDYMHQSRARMLGGSGNIWGGKCVPLDPSDFAPRSWVPRSGWPVTRAELQPFYDRACRLLEIPLFDRDYDQPQEAGRPPLTIDGARDFFSAPRYFSPVSGSADPKRFNAFRTSFAVAPNITVYLHSNVVEIRRPKGSAGVKELALRCLDGPRHIARGRTYVLATGGIENTRLLLASGFDSSHPMLGRCFMGHVTHGAFEENAPMSMLAVSDAARPMALYTDNRRDRFHCVLAATLEGQRRNGIGNFTATIYPAEKPPPGVTSGVLALAAALDAGSLAAKPAQPLPTYFMSEQLPDLESRITLDHAKVDALGLPQARLDWVYSSRDLDNLERGITALADALGAENLGRLCWPVPRDKLLEGMSPSRHHMGTTRISAGRDEGVVDPDCRLHGCDNLYVAGTSTFPTSGIANPTLTLIALTMRMSDHLKREMGERP